MSRPSDHHLDVLHRALQRVDHLWDELQPVEGGGVDGPHPGGLRVGRGRGALLDLRLVGQVVLILQHLHFQHLAHHVNTCAAQPEGSQRGCVWGGGGGGGGEEKWREAGDKTVVGRWRRRRRGGGGEEINSVP